MTDANKNEQSRQSSSGAEESYAALLSIIDRRIEEKKEGVEYWKDGNKWTNHAISKQGALSELQYLRKEIEERAA